MGFMYFFLLGIKDASTVSPDLTLVDLGLDSLMGVEIKQTLERSHSIAMSAKEIRALTFAKLDELSASTPQSAGDSASPPASETGTPAPATSIHYDFSDFRPTEAVVEMNHVDTEAAPLFVIHPIEGSVLPLSSAMSKISTAKVYGFQCTDDAPLTSVPDLASYYVKVCMFSFYNVKLIWSQYSDTVGLSSYDTIPCSFNKNLTKCKFMDTIIVRYMSLSNNDSLFSDNQICFK